VVNIKRLDSQSNSFKAEVDALIRWESVSNTDVVKVVDEILHQVKTRGDDAVLEYTNKFDRRNETSMQALTIDDCHLDSGPLSAYVKKITGDQHAALLLAAERIKAYAERQKMESWSFTEADGTVLGQQVTSLDRVGLYVPGGKAAYPSSVLMSAIPAKVAEVSEIIMVVPAPGGEINALVMAAAAIAGVSKVIMIGGAQAVAALAYGTESVPRVDKIVGPGNIYVATAKRTVFGAVGIDMVAGPSEILIVCDGNTDPDWIAMDLFSQAEHDEDAQAILISPDKGFLDKVQTSIEKLLPEMERAEIITQSLKNRGALISVENIQQAIELVNHIAPEHLELSVDNPDALIDQVKHAGAIFMGRHTAEALGDYCAGPNHVLPTAQTARFSSPLGVYDFQKRTSLINCSAVGASVLGETASILARGEGLTAHARSAENRIDKKILKD